MIELCRDTPAAEGDDLTLRTDVSGWLRGPCVNSRAAIVKLLTTLIAE